MATSEICREVLRSGFQTGMGPYWVFLLILFVIYLLCLSCFLVSSLQPCGQLLGKGWPLGSLVCDVCLYFCHLPMLCPGSGVVLDLSISDNCLFSNF